MSVSLERIVTAFGTDGLIANVYQFVVICEAQVSCLTGLSSIKIVRPCGCL